MTTVGTHNDRLDVDTLNRRFEAADAADVVAWAVDQFGERLVMTTSFGVQSAVMLHLVTSMRPDIPVIWIDTGFNFPETYRFVEELRKRLNLNLVIFQSELSPAHMVALHGKLWEQGEEGLDHYDRIRKIEPRDRAFRELNVGAWLTGPRRDQTDYRKSMQRIERFNDVIKVHPLLEWSSRHVDDYLKRHDLSYHPLYEKGFPSIGDWHSTTAAGNEAERQGRFKGLKQECGLHIPESEAENASRDSSSL